MRITRFDLKDIKNLRKTVYIELQKTDNTVEEIEYQSFNSKYIEEETFGLLEPIFSEINPDFDYYGETKFNKILLGKLRSKILSFSTYLETRNTFQLFFEFINQFVYIEKINDKNWNQYYVAIV